MGEAYDRVEHGRAFANQEEIDNVLKSAEHWIATGLKLGTYTEMFGVRAAENLSTGLQDSWLTEFEGRED